MRVTILGSGDAFGAGGRFQTCFLVETGKSRVLLDCGMTSLTAMRSHDVDPDTVDAILLTHLHGDHFGGVPLLLLEAMVATKRTRPLTVAGPAGTEERVRALGEALYAGMWRHEAEAPFRLEFLEMPIEAPRNVAGISVTPYPAVHSKSANPTALRLEAGGKVVTYTGDGEWSDGLARAAAGADLLIAECYYFLPRGSGHMDYRTLSEHRADLDVGRLVLTHMGEEMLARVDGLPIDDASDGKVLEV